MMISPSEPKPIIEVISKVVPETFTDWYCDLELGSDYYWVNKDRDQIGVQRKAFPEDFLASLHGEGSRLDKEVFQMRGLEGKLLILEGRPMWGEDGRLLNYMGEFDLWRLKKIIWSLNWREGIRVEWTTNHLDTARTILAFYHWTTKLEHQGFGERAKRREKKGDWREWILQGFKGLSRTRAQLILKHFDGLGEEPLIWNESVKLESVPGLGKVMAKNLKGQLKKDGG